METNVIYTRIEKVWLDENGIIHFEYFPGADNSLNDAIASIEAASKLYGGIKRPVIIDIRNQRSISRESRAYYAGEESAKIFLAAALIIGSPAGRVIGNFFMGLNKPLFPTQLFTDEAIAIDWLKKYLKSS